MTDYDENLPSGQLSLPILDDDTRSNFKANRERLEVEHRFPVNAETATQRGRHKFAVDTAANLATAFPDALKGMTRFNTDDWAWEVHDGTAWRQILPGYLGEVRFLGYRPGSPPAGWLECNGQQVSQSTYSKLFAKIGHNFQGGAPDPSPNFFLPDIRRRVLVGQDFGGGDWATAIGETGGSKTHQLSIAEMPAHDHNLNDPGHSHTVKTALDGGNPITPRHDSQLGSGSGGSTNSASTGITIDSQGGDAAHENRQPYITMYAMIFAAA